MNSQDEEHAVIKNDKVGMEVQRSCANARCKQMDVSLADTTGENEGITRVHSGVKVNR